MILHQVSIDIQCCFGLGMTELLLDIKNILAAAEKVCRVCVAQIMRRKRFYHKRNARGVKLALVLLFKSAEISVFQVQVLEITVPYSFS